MIAHRQAPESEYVTPTIVLLREHIETIRRGEIDRARRRLGKPSAEQEKAFGLLSHGIINEILHGPITALEASAEKIPVSQVSPLKWYIASLASAVNTSAKTPNQSHPPFGPKDPH
jgi:glutamyl-tRNA reductase